jgi:hypothetical protein
MVTPVCRITDEALAPVALNGAPDSAACTAARYQEVLRQSARDLLANSHCLDRQCVPPAVDSDGECRQGIRWLARLLVVICRRIYERVAL